MCQNVEKKLVGLIEVEKDIWAMEGMRVAFCKPKEIAIPCDYSQRWPLPLADKTPNELAKRVVATVGTGHPFLIVWGDGYAVKYANSTPEVSN